MSQKYRVVYDIRNSNNCLQEVVKTFSTLFEAMQYIRSIKTQSSVYGNPTLETINA
jgi:hypothetical protein